eukprot:403359433
MLQFIAIFQCYNIIALQKSEKQRTRNKTKNSLYLQNSVRVKRNSNLNYTQNLQDSRYSKNGDSSNLMNKTIDETSATYNESLRKSRQGSMSNKDMADLQRAYSTYLNATGPGDYQLPSLTHGKMVSSNKKNSPMFSFQSKTKLPYFPQCYTEFMGRDAPSSILYTPEPSKNKKQEPMFSIGKSPRFHVPDSVASLNKQLPVSYDTNLIKDEKSPYKKISLGYGQKMTYKTDKSDETNPGPIYQNEYYKSFKQLVDQTESRRNSTFGCDKEQMAKIMYSGQEKHYYGRHSPGPGSYNSSDKIQPLSSIRTQSQFSMPKRDRGLLTLKKDNAPNPFSYTNSTDIYGKIIAKKDGQFSMPKSERKFNFAKFNSLHSVLVQKGLY